MYAAYLRLELRVWDSDRAASRKLAPSARRDPASRDARKHFYREMLRHHADARRLVLQFRL
ncbi:MULTISPECIES: hypothetical protein [Xanthobacteraceae]|uniref:hypothetical protein n=1 Tax=Xanthobacteraceae TaxID=335928 RepID=UPI002ACA5708|nr:hypothetical protein [Labrys sp. ZIDIC5]MDZ5451526.1 hypothetical protein [Labrys sp. ZIDIC5]